MQTNLLDASTTIGNIAEKNSAYYYYLESQLIKPVEEMTVRELMDAHAECTRKFNEVEK